jgi:hypothetical protein
LGGKILVYAWKSGIPYKIAMPIQAMDLYVNPRHGYDNP